MPQLFILGINVQLAWTHALMEIDGYVNLDAIVERILNNEKADNSVFVLDTAQTVQGTAFLNVEISSEVFLICSIVPSVSGF